MFDLLKLMPLITLVGPRYSHWSIIYMISFQSFPPFFSLLNSKDFTNCVTIETKSHREVKNNTMHNHRKQATGRHVSPINSNILSPKVVHNLTPTSQRHSCKTCCILSKRLSSSTSPNHTLNSSVTVPSYRKISKDHI